MMVRPLLSGEVAAFMRAAAPFPFVSIHSREFEDYPFGFDLHLKRFEFPEPVGLRVDEVGEYCKIALMRQLARFQAESGPSIRKLGDYLDLIPYLELTRIDREKGIYIHVGDLHRENVRLMVDGILNEDDQDRLVAHLIVLRPDRIRLYQ